jgi:hypothetical protein
MMTTGYTRYIEDGTITSFKDFTMLCARAFGALIDMRDDGLDAPLPMQIKPRTYHSEQLTIEQEKLASMYGLSDEQWQSLYAAESKEFETTNASEIARNEEISGLYSAILNGVYQWKPPSKDHMDLKKFMIEQIVSSTEMLSPYIATLPSLWEWKANKISEVKRRIHYHTKEVAKERARAESGNKWLQDLRQSLESA